MRELIRQDFWDVVRPTLEPAREAGRQYLESNRYVERIDERKYPESDTGWPLIVADRMFAEGSPNWRSLFSAESGQMSKVLVDEVPALAQGMRAAVDLAERDIEFAKRLTYLYEVADPDRRTRYLQIEFLSIVGDILGRAESLGAEDEDSLLDLYLQVERGRFATELAGDIIVPLVLTAFDASEPVHLLGSFWLEPIGVELQRARALNQMYEEAASPWIAAAATHAIVQRDVVFPNTMWPPILQRGADRSPVPLETVERVLECIHLVTGKRTGYAQVLVRADSWVSWSGWIGDLPHVWRAVTTKAYPDSFDGGWLRSKEPISKDATAEIAAVLAALTRAPKNVQLAARRCFRSTFRADIEDEILDATIGIEALLSHGRDELTHRMSQRAAAALAGEFRSDAVYQLLKQVYTQRSQIVHGSTPKNSKVRFEDSEYSTNHMGVFLLRKLLRSYLLADEPWTPTSLDDLIVQRLGRVETDDEP
ncbi:hypothetical protein ACWF0M_12510 [Kribbella sp. NPDC055110]